MLFCDYFLTKISMENRVVHFEIQANDVNRAMNFYKKTFGWKIEKWMSADEKNGKMDYWGLITGEKDQGINGGLYERPKDRPVYNYDCTISVEDIDKSTKAVEKNGGKVRVQKMEIPEVGWFATCIDTEGNYFNLMQSTMKPM